MMFKPFEEKEIELFYEQDLATPSRTIYAGAHTVGMNEEEVGTDCEMAEKIIKGIHVLNCLGSDPISLIINDTGGDEYHGLAIYDAITTSRAPVDITVFGSAMSMASVTLQGARKRYLTPHSTIMIHMGNMEVAMDQRDIQANMKERDRINDMLYNIYLGRMREKNPRYSINQLKELLSTDRYLSPKEAIELGLADEVLK